MLDAEGGVANFEGVGVGTDLVQELVFICASFFLYRRIISRKTLSSSLLSRGFIHWVLGCRRVYCTHSFFKCCGVCVLCFLFGSYYFLHNPFLSYPSLLTLTFFDIS